MAMEKTAEIKDFGPLKSINAPPGWVLAEESGRGMSATVSKTFAPPPPNESDAAITVFYRGQPVTDAAAQTFRKVLDTKPAGRELTGDEIKTLADAMGYSNAGDNQFTNDAAKGTREYPVFHVATAVVSNLKGKTVLEVEGTFQDQNGMPTTEYRGFFIDSDGSGRVINEIFYQSRTKGKFMKYRPDFDKALKTLVWK
jgi:hypothetical protein